MYFFFFSDRFYLLSWTIALSILTFGLSDSGDIREKTDGKHQWLLKCMKIKNCYANWIKYDINFLNKIKKKRSLCDTFTDIFLKINDDETNTLVKFKTWFSQTLLLDPNYGLIILIQVIKFS